MPPCGRKSAQIECSGAPRAAIPRRPDAVPHGINTRQARSAPAATGLTTRRASGFGDGEGVEEFLAERIVERAEEDRLDEIAVGQHRANLVDVAVGILG